MKRIPLGGTGKFALIDDEDFEYVNQWKWALNPEGYVRRTIRKGKGYTSVRLHRIIMEAKLGEIVDHKDGNPLNNQRSNLRKVTRSQNQCNTKIMSNKIYSKYKGVTYDKARGKWKAQLQYEGKRYNIGRFNSESEAYEAYKKTAKEIHGEYTRE